MVQKPKYSAIVKLIDIKVISEKDKKYVYSEEFKATAQHLKEHPMGMFESTRMAYKVDSNVAPVLAKYARMFSSQNQLKNLATAYVMLVKHLARLNIKYTPETDVIYGVYYFNDHELSIEDVENDLS